MDFFSHLTKLRPAADFKMSFAVEYLSTPLQIVK